MINLQKFYQATDPSKTLFVENTEDKKYYIDFSSVRGGEIIGKLKKKITFFSPDAPTCVLFTGHIGCGKSTELLRLRAELEQEGFHVVYFESDQDMEMTDVDISDVLLAIARRISRSLEKINIDEPTRLKELLQGATKVLNANVKGMKVKVPGVGDQFGEKKMGGGSYPQINLGATKTRAIASPHFLKPSLGDLGVSSQGETSSLAFGIGEITAKAKNDSIVRERLNQYLGPQKAQLLEAINKELLEPAIAKLKQLGKKGLVVIVDNLDRLDSRPKWFGRPQQEYLFVDQGEYLSKLHCHLVYTMPLALKFSNEYGMLTQRFEEPKVLPMVSVQLQDGSDCEAGISLLRQMVLARVFPDLDEQQRLKAIPEIFDSPETLDHLCRVSGGYIRDLLRLLNMWIMEEMDLPLCRKTLEAVIRVRRNEMAMPISDDQWELLRFVRQRKKVSDDQRYQTLMRSRLVFEYCDHGESWFNVNPILTDAKELQRCLA